MDGILASHPAATGLIPGVPKTFSNKKLSMLPRLIDGAAAKSSGQQRLSNIDRTHLVLWQTGTTKKCCSRKKLLCASMSEVPSSTNFVEQQKSFCSTTSTFEPVSISSQWSQRRQSCWCNIIQLDTSERRSRESERRSRERERERER